LWSPASFTFQLLATIFTGSTLRSGGSLGGGRTDAIQSGTRFASSSRAWIPLSIKSISPSLSRAREEVRATGRGDHYTGSPRYSQGAIWPKNLLPFLPPRGINSPFFAEMDNLIEARELQIERKHFHVEFRENDRGKFLRITEEAHGRRNTIIVPSTGIDDFTAAIDDVIEHAERITPA